MVALGAFGPESFVAAKLVRGRAWTLGGALASSILLTLAGVGFLGLSLSSGLFSPLMMLAACAAVIALVFSALAITPFRKLLGVRRQLRTAGFDLDL